MGLGADWHSEVQAVEMAEGSLESHRWRVRSEFLQGGLPQASAEEQRFNYIIDFSGKWHGPYLQFIAHYACPGPNTMLPFFDVAFARLGYFRDDAWSLWARANPWFQF